jgi:hypothetical protein
MSIEDGQEMTWLAHSANNINKNVDMVQRMSSKFAHQHVNDGTYRTLVEREQVLAEHAGWRDNIKYSM